METRRMLHANLTVDAYTAIQSFCDDNGVTVTAFLEVLGQRMRSDPAAVEHMFPDGFVVAARRVDTSRRHRNRC